MNSYRRAIVFVNLILSLFFWSLIWIGHFFLPGLLGSEMKADVMLSKYELVCAGLTAFLALSCLVVIVLVNAVLIRAYFTQKKNIPSTRSEPNNAGDC